MHSNEVLFGLDPAWVSGGLFVAAYAAIMAERINRAIVALAGAALMILSGVLSQAQALEGVDFNTLGLLLGMMLIVNIAQKSGIFQFLAIWSVKLVRARPWAVLVMLSTATALLSALLDNVTTVLLTVPVTLQIAKQLDIKPYPYLFAQIFASNIGGTSTLIGDPPNIMIGSATGLTFNDFVINLGPVIVVIFAVTLVPIWFIWGRHLRADETRRQQVLKLREADAITDTRLLKQSLGVIAAVLAGFVLQRQLQLEAAAIAMTGAAVLLLLDNFGRPADEQTRRVHGAFSEAEWVTLMFFLGLFMLVRGIEHAGIINELAEHLLAATGGDFNVLATTILWSSAVLSAIIDNIPFVATMIPMIKAMGPALGGDAALLPLWWALSLGACLGGNGTLIGASANLVVAGLAERDGTRFGFVEYSLVAFPLMLISIVLSHVYLWWRYLGGFST